MKIKPKPRASQNLYYFFLTLIRHRDAFEFIKKHRPWRGFEKYGWVSKLMIGVAAVIGFGIYSNFMSWVEGMQSRDEVFSFSAGVSSFYEDFAVENYNWIFSGGTKYLILILIEVLVFHFIRKTLEIQTGKTSDSSFDAFIQAEIRMIKVAIRCFIYETICIALSRIPLGILGWDFLEMPVSIVIQCYFIGFVILDNYNECFGASINQSTHKIRQFAGVSMGIGMVAYLLMVVPVVGVIVASLFGSVTATLVMNELEPKPVFIVEEKKKKKKKEKAPPTDEEYL